jgi:hypothetical protein
MIVVVQQQNDGSTFVELLPDEQERWDREIRTGTGTQFCAIRIWNSWLWIRNWTGTLPKIINKLAIW